MGLFTIVDNTVHQALVFWLLALSAFISLRLLDFPDLTIEGSFPLGAAVAAVLVKSGGVGAGIAFPAAFSAGMLAGCTTALLHNRLNIGKLLSGILVAVSLYSVNFRIMGAQANLYITHDQNPLAWVSRWDTALATHLVGPRPGDLYPASNIILAVISLLFLFALAKFLRSEVGSLIRFSRSDCRFFLESIGINYKVYQTCGLSVANGLAGVAGAMAAFDGGTASLTMGFGIILVALVALVLGEEAIRLFHSDLTDLFPTIMAPLFGMFAYHLVIRSVRWLNTQWQTWMGFSEPTSQLQFFNADIRILSALIMIVIYVFRPRESAEISIPERL